MIARRAAVLFDRDGVLNADRGYVHRPEQFEWIDGARESIALCHTLGYLTVVVTNQSGVARGYYTEQDVLLLHAWMASQLEARGSRIDAFYYCPHHPEAAVARYRKSCACRKPGSGMLLEAIRDLAIDPDRSLLIGDKASDVQAAQGAGVRGVLFAGSNLLRCLEAALIRGPEQ